MAETDGLEEAAAELLRTATMAGAQLVEHLARARQQQLLDQTTPTRAITRDVTVAGRERERVDRAITRAERTLTPDAAARRTAAQQVDRVLAADRADACSREAQPAPEAGVGWDHTSPTGPGPAASVAWDSPVRRDRFTATLSAVDDPEAVEARLLLDRARAHPASAAPAEPAASPAARALVAPLTADRAADLGR